MIWKKHGEHLVEKGIILIMTNSKNKEDKFLIERIALYKKRRYKVNVKYF